MLKKLFLLSAASLIALPVAAGHDDLRPRELRVAQLASELHEATLRLEFEAFRRARHQYRSDPIVLRAIDRLEDRARQFELSVRRGRNVHIVERDLERLRRAFHNAAREMRFVRARRIRGDFAEVSWMMQRLERQVDVAFFPGRRGRAPVGHSRARGSVAYGDRDGDLRVRVEW